jgi:hypothetical protein
LHEPIAFENHVEWFGYLAFKCLIDAYFRTKSMRRYAQTREYPFLLPTTAT